MLRIQTSRNVTQAKSAISQQTSRIGNETIQCVCKVPLKGKLASDEGDAILAAFNATKGIEGVRPVRLVEVLDDSNCLLTESVSSQGTLFNQFWSATGPLRFLHRHWPSDRLAKTGRSLGTWLRAFHHGTQIIDSDATQAERNVARHCRGRMKSINAMAPGTLDEATVEALHEQVATLEANCVGTTPALCAIHGDLNLSNILVERGSNSLVIIDFGDGRLGLGIDDVATLHCTVSSMRAARGRPGRVLDLFLDELLDAYGQDKLDAIWRLMCIMCHLRLVLSYISFREQGRFARSSERAYAQISRASLHWLVNESFK